MSKILYIVEVNGQEFTGETLSEVLFQAYVHGTLPETVQKVTVLENGTAVSSVMPLKQAQLDSFLEKMFKENLH